MKLKHYYHLYAAGNWKEAVDEHADALVSSGLLEELGEVRVGLVGSPGQQEEALQHLRKRSIPYVVVAAADEGWEQVTMDVMYDDFLTADEPFYCLYAHTKGAQYHYDVQRPWRQTMTHWNVGQWRQAVHHLAEGSAACGVLWKRSQPEQEEFWFYAGNFFWVTSEDGKRVPPPKMYSRYDAEVWICEVAKLGKPMTCVYDSPINPIELMEWQTS